MVQDGGAPFPKDMELLPRPKQEPVGVKKAGSETQIPEKINKQLAKRGWSEDSVKNTRENFIKRMRSVDRKTGEPATAYFKSHNQYVVVNDKTGSVVQVSDLNKPNWKIPDYFKEWK